MPAKNRYAFLLSERGDVAKNVSDIYAQLQAPGQRRAVEDSLNRSVADSAPETRTTQVYVEDGEPVIVGYEPSYVNSYGELQQGLPIWNTPYHYETQYYTTPAANPVGYTDASTRAANAAYSATINPVDLLKNPGRDFQAPGYISNAYLNPASEGAYDLTPLFNSSGQQKAGIGATPRPITAVDRLLQEIDTGPSAQLMRYNNALQSNEANANFAAENANTFNFNARSNSARINNRNTYQRPDSTFLGNASRFGDPIQGTGNSSYQKQQSGRVDLPDYNRLFLMQQTAAREQAQIDAYQRSQTGMSQSFYRRGGHDNPSSFPSGYRL